MYIIAAIAFKIRAYSSCQDRIIKFRADDIMEEKLNMDLDEALELAEMHHGDAKDAMYENSQH